MQSFKNYKYIGVVDRCQLTDKYGEWKTNLSPVKIKISKRNQYPEREVVVIKSSLLILLLVPVVIRRKNMSKRSWILDLIRIVKSLLTPIEGRHLLHR